MVIEFRISGSVLSLTFPQLFIRIVWMRSKGHPNHIHMQNVANSEYSDFSAHFPDNSNSDIFLIIVIFLIILIIRIILIVPIIPDLTFF